VIFKNEDLHALVQELSKKNPNSELVKSKSNRLGIPYNNDLIILMSEVLIFLSKTNSKKHLLKDKSA
jgi:hypothetical protein